MIYLFRSFTYVVKRIGENILWTGLPLAMADFLDLFMDLCIRRRLECIAMTKGLEIECVEHSALEQNLR